MTTGCTPMATMCQGQEGAAPVLRLAAAGHGLVEVLVRQQLLPRPGQQGRRRQSAQPGRPWEPRWTHGGGAMGSHH